VTESVVALSDAGLRPGLSKIGVPTAIFHAVGDKIRPSRLRETNGQKPQNSTIVRLEHNGNGLFVEDKENFNRN
jgi:hypothetical protein